MIRNNQPFEAELDAFQESLEGASDHPHGFGDLVSAYKRRNRGIDWSSMNPLLVTGIGVIITVVLGALAWGSL